MKRVGVFLLTLLVLLDGGCFAVGARPLEEMRAYPLSTYVDGVTLLGGARRTDDGAALETPLDGIAFYADVSGKIAVSVRGTATLCVFVDGAFDRRVTVCEVEATLVDGLTAGMHRVEAVLDGASSAVITGIRMNGNPTAVPATPRTMRFVGEGLTAEQQMTVAQSIGMACRSASFEERDDETDVVIVSKDAPTADDEATMDAYYPHALIVFAGQDCTDVTYGCARDVAALTAYLKETVVPASYFDELADCVTAAKRWLDTERPTADNAAKLRLELDVCARNDGVSGVLYGLYEALQIAPKAGLTQRSANVGKTNTLALAAGLVGGGVTILLAGAVAAVLYADRVRKRQHNDETQRRNPDETDENMAGSGAESRDDGGGTSDDGRHG